MTNADTVEYKQKNHILFEMSLEDSVACLQKGPDVQLFIRMWQKLQWSLK